jgi:hypothetical protein
MKHDVAGDPMTGLRWTRRTTEKLALELGALGIQVSANTVGRLLKEMGFSLRVNHKKRSAGSGPDRDEQFAYIAEQRQRFSRRGDPTLSVDTKKKELVGDFKNQGTTWQQKALEVNDHDFRSAAYGIAIPYGVYDVLANRGHVFVGTSSDTPLFATHNVGRWWTLERSTYRNSSQILILADGGGSNGYRNRAWKLGLQTNVCDRYGLTVTVCHYPTGASKWNPIEHRFFSHISGNWAGEPLTSYETILNYIRTTTTSTGLTADAHLVTDRYEKGVRVPDEEMASLALQRHEVQPQRNYTLSPR